MIEVNNDFKLKSKKVKQQDVKVTVGEERHKIKQLVYSFDGALFKTIMKQVEITDNTANQLKDKDINFKYGLYINNAFQYVDLGNFYIKDMEDDKKKEEITVTGYDRMIRFMKTFKQSELQLTYPCAILTLVKRMCKICEMELYSTNFFNSDLVVNEDFFTAQELTYRDVLEKIAQITLTTAFIKENKLYFCKPSNVVSQQLDKSYISNLVVKEKFGPLNALVLGRGSVEDNVESVDEESITQNGRCEIRFDENEFVQEQREKVIDNMFEQIKGLEYYSFEASDLGVMWLEPCDCIELGDRDENFYKTYYLKANIKFTTGIASNSEAEVPNEANTQYKVTSKAEKKTLKVERLAKKNKGLIQDLIQENTETSEKLVKHEQDINGIKNTVQSIQDFTREKEQNDNIFLDDIAEGEGYVLNFTAYGNSTTFNSKDITICAGTKPRGVGNLIYLTTESGEDLLTEDGQEFIVGEKSYYVKSQKVHLSDVLRSFKIDDTNTVYDTLEVLQDGTIQVTRRIGVNSSGNEYVLENEIIEKINETMILPSLEGKIYYFIDECDNLKYYIKYITQNDYSDSFLGKLNLGTEIEQNAEHVRVAWNQISQFLQLEGIEGKATLSIYDKDKNLLMTLNDEGQHFYENDEIFGEMGVSIEQQSGNTKNRYIAFSVDCEYDNTIGDGMAWGVKTQSDGKFWPILYIKDFTMPPKNSGGCTGKLVLAGCNLELDSEGAGISTSQVRIHGDALPGLYFDDEKANKTLLSIIPAWGNNSAAVQILDNINLYANKAGSNTLKIGDNSAYCFMTDDGTLSASGWADIGGYLLVHGTLTSYGDLCVGQPDANAGGVVYGNFDIRGNVYANNISSDKRIKTKIKNSTINALDIIKKIKHRQFYKDDGKHYDIGYIAQEMEQIDPNFVLIRPKTEKDDEMYYINELPIIATLSKAIQEQQKQIEKIQEEKDEQDKLIKSLIERIEKLEGGK